MQLLLGILLALASAFLWGFTTVIARVFLKSGGSMILSILRFIISAPIYLLLLAILGFPPLTSMLLFIIFLSSLAGFILGDFFFFYSMKLMGVAKSTLLVTMYPLWTMILVYFLLGREITVTMIMGALFIIFAVSSVVFKKEEEKWHPLGVLYSIITQFLWALAVVSIDWLLVDLPVYQVTGLRIIAGGAISLTMLPFLGKQVIKLSRMEWAYVAIISIFGMVIAQYTFTKSIELAGSGIAAPVGETSPLIATVLAKLFLKEEVTPRLFIAILLMVAGVFVLSL